MNSEEEGRMKKKLPTIEPMKTTNVSTGNRFEPLSDHEDTDIQ
jgi:hypothetical protein